jgi:hypothetical protein
MGYTSYIHDSACTSPDCEGRKEFANAQKQHANRVTMPDWIARECDEAFQGKVGCQPLLSNLPLVPVPQLDQHSWIAAGLAWPVEIPRDVKMGQTLEDNLLDDVTFLSIRPVTLAFRGPE